MDPIFVFWMEKQGEEYLIPRAKKKKVHKLNPRTNRMKNFKRNSYLKTDVPPNKRTFRNKPDSVRFQDWLLIKTEPGSMGLGKSQADGKWYGWSHRAVFGFSPGFKVTKTTCGNNTGREYTIKTDEQAKQAAINFYKDVA